MNSSPRASATSVRRSATCWAEWCFHSLGQACLRSRQRWEGAQRRALGAHRQDRARGEVDADARRRLRRSTPACFTAPQHASLEREQPVVWVLERPVGRQLLASVRQRAVDHAMGVGGDGAAPLRARLEVEQQRPRRLRAEVDADRVGGRDHRAITRRRLTWRSAPGAPPLPAVCACRARRYSSTTISLSSSTELSAVGLSKRDHAVLDQVGAVAGLEDLHVVVEDHDDRDVALVPSGARSGRGSSRPPWRPSPPAARRAGGSRSGRGSRARPRSPGAGRRRAVPPAGRCGRC